MSIEVSSKASAIRLRRTSLVASAVCILLAVTFLVVWVVLPREQVAMWMEHGKSWLLPELQGPYTPTEDLLILSSTFSVVVSTVLEVLLIFVLRNKSRQTKTWLRFTLYTILFANAALAFAAFLYASANAAAVSDPCISTPGGLVEQEYGHLREADTQAWDGIKPNQDNSYEEEFKCGRRVVSRWLSLLISLFSVVLLVSAWLDFREQDHQEYRTSRHSEESLSEKGLISTSANGTLI